MKTNSCHASTASDICGGRPHREVASTALTQTERHGNLLTAHFETHVMRQRAPTVDYLRTKAAWSLTGGIRAVGPVVSATWCAELNGDGATAVLNAQPILPIPYHPAQTPRRRAGAEGLSL